MREKHLFQFAAADIAAAARTEAEYHRKRLAYWQEEQEQAIAVVKETAGVAVKEQPVTGGKRVDVVIDYGDIAAYRRMQEAGEKITVHREAAERYETDFRVYSTQDARTYELETSDVHYYRLGGGPRQD